MASLANASQMRTLTGARFYGTQTGGSAASPIGGTMSAYQRAFDAAKNANEARYQDILSQYAQRYQRGMTNLQGMGDQAIADVNADYQGLSSRTGQSMVDRGLTGTTIAPSMQAGIERERQGAVGRVNESVRSQRLQTDASLSADKLAFMERRTDAYPDPNFYLRLQEMQTSPAPQGSTLYGRALSQRPAQARYNGNLYTSNAQMSAYEQALAAQATQAEYKRSQARQGNTGLTYRADGKEFGSRRELLDYRREQAKKKK